MGYLEGENSTSENGGENIKACVLVVSPSSGSEGSSWCTRATDSVSMEYRVSFFGVHTSIRYSDLKGGLSNIFYGQESSLWCGTSPVPESALQGYFKDIGGGRLGERCVVTIVGDEKCWRCSFVRANCNRYN